MADVPQSPTEAQLAEVKSAQDAEIARWQGDFQEEDLLVPYKREAEDKKDDDADKSEEDTGADDKPDDSEDTKAPEVVVEDEPVPVVTAVDPGEYVPADYSFEVTLANGKTVTVKTPEEAEKLADDPENFETPKQLMDFMNKQNKMQRNLDRDYEKWEAQHDTFTQQLDTETERREQIDGYVNEFAYLVSKGLLPVIPEAYMNADWSDPEIAKQPAVKAQQDILEYMVKENKARAKAKIKPLTSIVDAYNAYQQDADTKKARDDAKAAEDAHRAAGEARRTAGARVAGVSPNASAPYVPKGIAVGNPNVLKRGAGVWDD